MSNTVTQICTSKLLTSSQTFFSLVVSGYLVFVSSAVINEINRYRDDKGFDANHATDMNDDGVQNHDMMGLAVSAIIGSCVYFLWNLYFFIRTLTDEKHTELEVSDEKNKRDILTVSGFQTIVVAILLFLFCFLWGGFEHDRVNNRETVWQGTPRNSSVDLPSNTLAAWIALSVNLLTCLIDLFMLCRTSQK